MDAMERRRRRKEEEVRNFQTGTATTTTTTMINSIQKPASLFNLLLLLPLLLVPFDAIHCQSSSQPTTTIAPSTIQTSGTTLKPSTLSDRVADATTLAPPPSPNSSTTATATTTTGEILLSGNEFVDFTEAPTLLFDGSSNESNDTQPPAIEANRTDVVATSGQPQNNSTQAPQAEPKTTTIPPNSATDGQMGPNGTETTTSGEEPPATTVKEQEEPAGETDDTTGGGDGGDEEAPDDATREPNGGNIRGETAFEPPRNVSQYMDYIERLFHDLRHQITDLFEPYIPQLIRTSQMVQLSGSCSYDMLRMALALRQFEPWALRMIDSSGKVPEGIFEGSFTALGSYDECLSTVFASSSDSGGGSASSQAGSQQSASSQQPTQGKYCLVNVSPFLPPKPPADRVELMFQEEANRRNYTKDDQFSRLSPMFYYMQFRIGVCIPSTCDDSDMDSISGALSSSLRLNITIPHCRVKHNEPITRHQLVGGLVFALVLVTVLGATIMDYWRRKMERLNERNKRIFVLQTGGDGKSLTAESLLSPAVLLANCNFTTKTTTTTTGGGGGSGSKLSSSSSKSSSSSSLSSSSSISSPSSSTTNFNERFRQHWSWMSFSLLTNYKLYFTHKQPPSLNADPPGRHQHHLGQPEQEAATRTPIVRCLNGIRVLSLCWVIVANSYITLDPRATKRLTKTRDAPKDFLFQLVAQASLAIETFFFLSGILVSMSFARKLNPQSASAATKKPEMDAAGNGKAAEKMGAQQQQQQQLPQQSPSYLIQWFHFYVHRYIRMTPATMLVIAFTMFAFRYGDGPLWFEATHKAHMSCSANWWRHLLHVANFIDTRQMCFIHYWYIAADMQLFLFAPILMFLIYQRRRIGYAIATLIGLASMGFVFYTTYIRNLPPTLLFYNSDPESRREFGNTIMTKPLTHALPYMVGMLVGKWLTTRDQLGSSDPAQSNHHHHHNHYRQLRGNRSLATLLGLTATIVALAEVFLPYKWNNSHLPTRFMAALYAAVFRFCWSLVLAYLVIACAHPPGRRCRRQQQRQQQLPPQQQQRAQPVASYYATKLLPGYNLGAGHPVGYSSDDNNAPRWIPYGAPAHHDHQPNAAAAAATSSLCLCGSGGNLVNRLLSLEIFTHLSKLSFVAYLIHLPLMSVFIAQTRGLFAFSHTLVMHLALSYLVMTFILAFVLVHIIEFPFLTFERYLFQKLFYGSGGGSSSSNGATTRPNEPVNLSQPNGMMMMMGGQPKLVAGAESRGDRAPIGAAIISSSSVAAARAEINGHDNEPGPQQVARMGGNYHHLKAGAADEMNHGNSGANKSTVDNNQVDGLREQAINRGGGGAGGNSQSSRGLDHHHHHQNDETMMRQTSYRKADDETFRISERL